MPFDPHSDRPVVFKNNGAVVLWLFMALWMTMLVSCSKNFETLGAGVSASAIAVIVFLGAESRPHGSGALGSENPRRNFS